MSTIRISRYNNYFNRRVLRGTPTTIAQFENIQFNPNDGVDTSLILNTSTMLGCDYLTAGSNSHWFIMDSTRIREGQWKVTLHRDVLRDYYDSYKDSTIFIDKAVPTSVSDITIFNKENNSYNQIKKSQTLLSNDTIPWIVGYMTSKADSYTVDLTESYPEIESIDKYKYSSYFHKNVYRPVTNNMEVYVNVTGTQNNANAIWNQRLSRTSSGWSASANTSPSTTIADIINSNHRGSNTVSFSSSDVATIRSQLATLFNNYDTAIKQGINETIGAPSDYSRIAAENNKIYRSQENGKLYKITATTITDNISRLGVKVNNYLYMKLDSINNQVNSWTFSAHDSNGEISVSGDDYITFASKNYEISGAFNGLILDYEEYTPTNSIVIPANRTHCNDSQYDIFMIPYGNQGFTTKADNLKLAYKLISSLSGSGTLYDIQILPFKPEYNASTVVSATGLNAQMRFIDKASDNFQINHTLTCATTVKGRKKQSECQFYRLSSPNWAGSFEFNVAKNMADITKFKVSYTLKPYTPYVRICPVFNQSGLYAGHNSDAMGLILSGDFSLAMINDAWATYQLQNKNYEKIFDRDIQSLDLQQRIQKDELIMGGIAGAIAGGVGLGINTGLIAGPTAAISAGALGGIGSAVAGHIDYQNQTKLMEDTRSASIDKFNWQLGNIKATPNTLTKVGSYNIDNKYSFILEEYDATDAEKDILDDLLEYEGYTINKIATIDDYSSSSLNYLKGRFIKLDIEDDSHVANIINYEISKGVFI